MKKTDKLVALKKNSTQTPDGRHGFFHTQFHRKFQNCLSPPPPPLSISKFKDPPPPFQISIKLLDTVILIYTQLF